MGSGRHIEVLREGASARYGSDAVAGVINRQQWRQPGHSTFSPYGYSGAFYYGKVAYNW